MAFAQLVGCFMIIATLLNLGLAVPVRIMFEKCDTKGFTCANSNVTAGRADIVFSCVTNVTSQDVAILVWQFNAPSTIITLTIQNCDTVRLSFTCSGENKPIQKLTVRNVNYLEISQATITHNPPLVEFENITNIETLPRSTFTQIKKEYYKPGCFIPINDFEGAIFKNVNIGTIETEAFRNLSEIKNFTWENVSVSRIALNAIDLTFAAQSGGRLKQCNLEMIEPMAFRITGERFSITRSRICNIGSNGINGTVYDFEFTNNSVDNIQSGALSVLAQNVEIIDNNFQRIESGAFQKIAPGLLHDSMRSFGNVEFVYKFNRNLVQLVEDGGIRPDIIAYNNVNAVVTYTYNTLQCSCEGLAWLGPDVDLGFGYSVLQNFNAMILDSQNSNICNFKPCLCFGVRPPQSSSKKPFGSFGLL